MGELELKGHVLLPAQGFCQYDEGIQIFQLQVLILNEPVCSGSSKVAMDLGQGILPTQSGG